MQQIQPMKPTLANIKANFGETSTVFHKAMTTLQNYLPTVAQDSHWQTAYQQWEKFLTLAYGKFDNSPEVFLVHTYLSMFAKLLAYTVLTGQVDSLPAETLQKVLQGEQFKHLNIERFVEDDFYAWVAVAPHFDRLQTVGRNLLQQLAEYDLTGGIQEDILKGVYQELIDLETRHALGEYYTPDWLCEKMLASLTLQEDSSLLDPACGSGSFLRAAIAQLRQAFPSLTATQLTQQVVGIDIHPLSVQIAKTTVLLALSDLLRQERRPVTLNVYLANSLSLPDGLAGLKNHFDAVVGNPPWLTYANVTQVNYQKELYQLAQQYDLIPNSKVNLPQLEIAAIFLAYSVNYFLKLNGVLAFVLPRSFLTADQHDNTRSGQVKGLELTAVWDLQDVSPLFRVPAMVLFAKPSANSKRTLPDTGIDGYSVAGKLDSPHHHWRTVEHCLEFEETRWFYSILAKTKTIRSALTRTEYATLGTQSYYAPLFKNGATIIPRSFYFIDIAQPLPAESDWKDRVLMVKTSKSILRDAKLPWKHLTLAGRINSQFLFRTALAKNVVPFVLINPPLVLLPLSIKKNQGKFVELLTQKQLFERGELDMAKWFKRAEELWEENKTAKNQENEIDLYTYLNWQHKLTSQNLNLRYLVLYTASSQDANAVVVDREVLDLEFLVESTAYWFATDKGDEANYLTSFLNCRYTNQLIKEFQSRGLFGPRHVCKKILEVPFPHFDRTNDLHRTLAQLGQHCAIKAKTVVENDKDLDLTPFQLGRLRRTVRQALRTELQEIDNLVEEISKSL